MISSSGLTVAQAQSIDSKVDDGLPQSGNVTALLVTTAVYWSAGGSGTWPANAGAGSGFGGRGGPTTAATPGSATTCFDNGSVVGPQQYSLAQDGGSNINCALSFRFQ